MSQYSISTPRGDKKVELVSNKAKDIVHSNNKQTKTGDSDLEDECWDDAKQEPAEKFWNGETEKSIKEPERKMTSKKEISSKSTGLSSSDSTCTPSQPLRESEDSSSTGHVLTSHKAESDGTMISVLPSSSSRDSLSKPLEGYENSDSTTNGLDVTLGVDLTLHEAVFKNDANKIYEFLKNKETVKTIINGKDKHGNTPLHLACMLGRSKEIISALLESGASVDCKNLNRWTPYHEAISYGNRDIIKLMAKQLNDDVYDSLNKHKLQEKLEQTRNYRLVLRWEFQTWVPLVSRVLPGDVCVINKQGKYIRIDSGLLNNEIFNPKRQTSCLIYSDKFEKKWIVVNNALRKYQYFETPKTDLETKVDEFMSIDIMDFEMKSTDIQLTRSTSGWIWKADKMEKVGKYNSALYNFNNVFLITRKRREHLKEEDLRRNKLAYKGFAHLLKFGKKLSLKELEDANPGYESNEDNQSESWEDALEEPKHRVTLPPPPPTNVSWNQYCEAEPGQFPTLGRPHKLKEIKTAFKAKIAVSDEFPITKNEFLDLLSIVPLKLFKKLKEFIEMRLPDGFPVRLDIPILPFLSARITFEEFNFIDGPIDESLFDIPDSYEESFNIIPQLGGKMRGGANNSAN